MSQQWDPNVLARRAQLSPAFAENGSPAYSHLFKWSGVRGPIVEPANWAGRNWPPRVSLSQESQGCFFHLQTAVCSSQCLPKYGKCTLAVQDELRCHLKEHYQFKHFHVFSCV